MPGCTDTVIVDEYVAETIKSCMAKIPSIVVESVGGGLKNGSGMDQQHLSGRPSRLEKQEEFEMEDELSYIPSPVTIQIEDRGSGPDERSGDEVDTNGSKLDANESHSFGGKDFEGNENNNTERSKVPTQRVKLLVRSHAVHDDASPPPDLETVVTNMNMLSVTNAPAFATQTQSKSSSKKRLGREGSSQGSQGSTETSSSGLSRDSSTETYTDSTGIDLQQFIIDTLHKNQQDRIMLLKIEQELISFVKDAKRHSFKFGTMSSYNRMLVHRVGAFFGLDHFVDPIGTSVIVNKTKNTRLPDARFQDYVRKELLLEEPKKSILKRDSISFEENKEHKSPERQSSTDSRRSKSFEEREEEYEKARARIFQKDEGLGESPLSRRSSQEDIRWPSSDTRPWSSTDSDSSGRPLAARGGSSFETEGSGQAMKAEKPVAVLAKAESDTKEYLYPNRLVRPVMTKASSFGGISLLSRETSMGKSKTPRITKAESFNVTTLSSSHVNANSMCTSGQHLLSTSCATSPSLIVSSSSIGSQTSVQSFYPTAQQSLPTVAGQPPQLQIPIQQLPSQVQGWPVGNKIGNVENCDVPVGADYGASHATAGQQQQVFWPASSSDIVLPGSIVVNPQTGSRYFNLDNVLCHYKLPPSSTGQAIRLTPYQQLTAAPQTLNQVPISNHISAPGSPPTNQQQQTLPQHKQNHVSIQVPLVQQRQSNVQQVAQVPTVVYVPYIQSQVQTPQLSVPSAAIHPIQQSQPTQLPADYRFFTANPNPSGMDELSVQMPSLSLVTSGLTPPQQQQEQPAAVRNLVTIDPSSPPHGFVVPGYRSPQGNVPQFPMYYMSNNKQATNVQPIRFLFPCSSVAQQGQPGSGSNMGLGSQLVTGIQPNNPTQPNPQIAAGPQYVPHYPILALSQAGDMSAHNALVSYTVASQTTAITTTTSALVPSSPMSMQVYPYGNLVLGNPSTANQMPFTSPSITKSPHSSMYVQTPIAVQTPTPLPVYVITTSSSHTPIAQSQSVMTAPFGSLRSQSLPSTPSNVSAILNPQLSNNGASMSYMCGRPQHIASSVSPSQHTPGAIAITTQTTQSMSQLAPSIFTTFQVLRPNVPIAENIRNGTPPSTPMQSMIAHYASPPAPKQVPLSFPFVKQASDPGADCFSITNVGSEQSRNMRTNQQYQMLASAPHGPSGMLYHRGGPMLQDLCFVGHPLQQHHFNQLMLSQQRPRFINVPGSINSSRPPKNRHKWTKGNQSSNSNSGGKTAGSAFQHSPELAAGHVLEIESIPEGMKRSEVERYLDQVTCHGAKIQFLDADRGTLVSSESDFLVTSQHLTVAVFDSDNAAQSALLGIKTPKFQLRPLQRNIQDVSQKKYS